MSEARLPWTLPLLPGLRWSGKLRVSRVYPDGSVLVAFDAEIVGAEKGSQRFVYDVTILSARQFFEWTGVPTTDEFRKKEK